MFDMKKSQGAVEDQDAPREFIREIAFDVLSHLRTHKATPELLRLVGSLIIHPNIPPESSISLMIERPDFCRYVALRVETDDQCIGHLISLGVETIDLIISEREGLTENQLLRLLERSPQECSPLVRVSLAQRPDLSVPAVNILNKDKDVFVADALRQKESEYESDDIIIKSSITAYNFLTKCLEEFSPQMIVKIAVFSDSDTGLNMAAIEANDRLCITVKAETVSHDKSSYRSLIYTLTEVSLIDEEVISSSSYEEVCSLAAEILIRDMKNDFFYISPDSGPTN